MNNDDPFVPGDRVVPPRVEIGSTAAAREAISPGGYDSGTYNPFSLYIKADDRFVYLEGLSRSPQLNPWNARALAALLIAAADHAERKSR